MISQQRTENQKQVITWACNNMKDNLFGWILNSPKAKIEPSNQQLYYKMRWSLFIRPTWSSCTLASELLSLSSSSLLCSCWEAEKKTYIKYIKMCTILKVSLQEDEIYLRRAVWCLAVNLLSWLDWRRLYPSQILHSVYQFISLYGTHTSL